MDTLHGVIEHAARAAIEAMLGDLLARRAAAHGIKLSQRKRTAVARRLLSGDTSVTVKNWWKWWERDVAIDLTQDDLDKIVKAADGFTEKLPGLFTHLSEQMADVMLADLRKRWPKHSKVLRKDAAGFRRRLLKHWEKPIELLRMLHTMALEVGATVNDELTHSAVVHTTPHTFDVLRRSHARGCQITAEVLTLLENGFADGAMARWRTLHEVSVVAALIARHGEDLAERYVRHEVVESKRAADEYQRCAPELGYELMTEGEMLEVRAAFDDVVRTYGAPFATPYGWAAHQLQNPRPTFADIERAADVDHLRAHYRLASHNVHSNPKGIFFQLGLLPETPLLLAGASNAGFMEPGQATAMSLVQITASLVTLQPTLDNAIVLRALSRLSADIPHALGEADASMKAKARHSRSVTDAMLCPPG